jgi:hypothetical protein
MNEIFCSDTSDAEIREEAYRLYVASGCVPGRDLDNWLLAQELVARRRRALTPSEPNPERLHFPPSADAQIHNTLHPFRASFSGVN